METNLIYLLIIALSLFATVFGMFLAYYKLFRKYTLLKSENLKSESSITTKNTELVIKGQEDYIKIIKEANAKAKEIIEQALLFKAVSKKALDEAFSNYEKEQDDLMEGLSDDIRNDFKKSLRTVTDKNIQIVNNISKDIQEYSISQIKDYKNIIEKETFQSQKVLEEKIETEYKQVEFELEAYKRSKMQKIDDDFYQLVEQITKIILGRAISIEEQENLVIDALEKAKIRQKFI